MAEYYFIVNRKSRTGRADAIWREVQKELDQRKIDYQAFVTEYKGHATELAAQITTENTTQSKGKATTENTMQSTVKVTTENKTQITEENVKKLVVVGGDGTSNEVINGIRDFSKVRIGFIPTGSGNDLGRGLGLKADALHQLERILHAKNEFKIDLGCVSWNEGREKRFFAISSGIGLDADVCKQALTTKLKNVLNTIHLGNLTYVLLTIKTLFSMETCSAEFVTDNGKKIIMDRMICAVAMNLAYEGGGVPMAPHAVPTDGELSFCCISGIPKWRTFLCLPFLVTAKHEKIKGFTIVNCKEADLKLKKKMIVHADGEYCGNQDQLHFSCAAGALRVMI